MTFAMILLERPLSLGAEHFKGYQARIERQARRVLGSEPTLDGDLYARLVWFHAEPTRQDADNIIKRILDALAGAVYQDDSSVMVCLARRVYLDGSYSVSEENIAPGVYADLIRLIEARRPNFVYIEIGRVVAQRVMFGSIEQDDG